MTALITSISFFALVLGSAAIAWMSSGGKHRPIDERFQDLAEKVRVAEPGHGGISGMGQHLLTWAAGKMPMPQRGSARAERVNLTLVQAGFLGSRMLSWFYLVRLGVVAGGALLGLLVGLSFGHSTSDYLVCVATGSIIGIMGPTYYIKRKARIRQNLIANDLSDVLDLLVVSVEAGLGIAEAIKVVGGEIERQDRVIGRELAMVGGEMSAGRSLGDALRSMAERSAVEDVKPLAATLIQSEQLGAQIGPALRASSDALRSTRRLRAEENAQKLSIKILFPLVLLVLPAMLCLILGPAMIEIVRTIGA